MCDSSFFYNSSRSISGLTSLTTRVLRVTNFFDFGLLSLSDSESEYEYEQPGEQLSGDFAAGRLTTFLTAFAFGATFELDDVEVPTDGMFNKVAVSVNVSFLFLDSLMASGACRAASDASSFTGEKIPFDGGVGDLPRTEGDLDLKRHLALALAVLYTTACSRSNEI